MFYNYAPQQLYFSRYYLYTIYIADIAQNSHEIKYAVFQDFHVNALHFMFQKADVYVEKLCELFHL